MMKMNGPEKTEERAWDVDGPDPVRWPGENYEMLGKTAGFVEPGLAVKMLGSEGHNPWKIDQTVEPNVENIYSLERETSPWRVRARLAGDGVHPDAEFVQYVLEFKCLIGTQENGSYQEMEVARGSLADLVFALSGKLSGFEERFPNPCRFKSDYRIMPSWELPGQVANEATSQGSST